jgi:hypothetical protein
VPAFRPWLVGLSRAGAPAAADEALGLPQTAGRALCAACLPTPPTIAGPAPGGLGAEATAEALAGAALAGVLLQAAPAWAPRALEPYLRGVALALAGPQAAAARRNGRFLALVEARARAPARRHDVFLLLK